MLLAIDVGNTSTGLAFYDGKRRTAFFRAQTDAKRTADEWGILLTGFFAEAHIAWKDVGRVALCSVVPTVSAALEATLHKYPRPDIVDINAQLEIGMAIRYDRNALGADRFANAAGAYLRDPDANWIILDFGTATKIEAVLAGGVYAGGAILPGIGISCDALFARAAKLSQVELTVPPSVIASNTADALRSGILHGSGAQAAGMIQRFQDELGLAALPRIAATGGYADQVAPFAATVRNLYPFWTLDSIRLIAERVAKT